MLASVALVCTIALCLHLWAWLEPTCANENRRIIMKAAGGVGCFEFWLYRYQSLIGNVLTAAVAGITLIWVARQLGPADRQASAIAAQTLKTVAGELAEQASKVETISGRLLECAVRPRLHYPVVWKDVAAEHRSVNDYLNHAGHQLRAFDAVNLENGTPPMSRFARELATALGEATQAIRDLHNFRSAYEAEIDAPVSEGFLDEFREMSDRYSAAFSAAYDAADRALAHLQGETQLAWREVRELEAKAIGPWWRKRNIRALVPDNT